MIWFARKFHLSVRRSQQRFFANHSGAAAAASHFQLVTHDGAALPLVVGYTPGAAAAAFLGLAPVGGWLGQLGEGYCRRVAASLKVGRWSQSA